MQKAFLTSWLKIQMLIALLLLRNSKSVSLVNLTLIYSIEMESGWHSQETN